MMGSRNPGTILFKPIPHNVHRTEDGVMSVAQAIHPWIYDRIRSIRSTVIVAGHYCLAEHMTELSHRGTSEIYSFEVGVKLLQSALLHDRKCTLVVWVNDIGIPIETRNTLKENYKLPSNYLEILNFLKVPEANIRVIFESSMRNKASTLLRKLYKRDPDSFERVQADRADLIRCVGGPVCDADSRSPTAYVVKGPSGEPLVVKEGSNPKCNLILATFFRELNRQFKPQWLLNVFNDVYTFRVALGVHVAQTVLDNRTPITNVFCDEKRVYCGDNDCLT